MDTPSTEFDFLKGEMYVVHPVSSGDISIPMKFEFGPPEVIEVIDYDEEE